MRSLFDLVFDQTFEREPVNGVAAKRGNQGGNRSVKHGHLPSDIFTLDRVARRFKHTAFCIAVICTLAVPQVEAQSIGLSESDQKAVIRALQAAGQKRWSFAEAQIANTRDPLAARIYYWMYYTDNPGPFPFNRISTFVRQVPDWPQQGTLQLAAEKSVTDNTPPDAIIRWFEDYTPKTSDGMDRYLKALRAENKTKQMENAINAWWGDASLTAEQQVRFLSHYGKLIGKESHKRRFNVLLYKGQMTSARALARILGQGYPQLAEARIALASGESGVDQHLARVPPHLQNDPGLAFERLRWRRKKDLDFRAIEILHNAPPANLIANPDDWWKERHILVRRLIEKKQYESAYLLVSKHGMKEGSSYAEAQFLAGWLALRFLNKPWEAFEYFEAMYHKSTMPITRARAAYWAGLASESLKYKDIARQWYEMGAKFPTTFYGQMALAKLGRDSEPVALKPTLSVQVRQDFEKDALIQAGRIFYRAGIRNDASAFLRAYADKAETIEQFYLAARVANEWQHYHDSIAVAKKAQTRGVVMADYAFPTMLARMKPVKTEWALLHAIIRQESQFDPQALSPAGARGLMQLMPATAKETAKKAGISHQNEWLTARPDYNIQLGSLYIAQMVSRFDGSYPLAIAAYNAGPGRVNSWIKMNGDPRSDDIDMIDWVEMIPVAETRNYVQRVLEGVYIYRHKFENLQSASAPIHTAHLQKPLKR